MPPTLPCPLPDAPRLPGRLVDIVNLDLAAHTTGLWQAIGAEPGLWTWIPSGPFATEAEFAEWLGNRSKRERVILKTALDKTGPVPAGLYFLANLDPAMGVAEFGLMLGPALSGRTGGTEAFFLQARYLFETLGYRRLEWRCDPGNLASVRAAERFGFTREGVLRQAAWLKGRSWDTALYALLDHEWPAVASRLAAWLDPANFDAEGRQIRPLAEFGQPYLGSSHHGK